MMALNTALTATPKPMKVTIDVIGCYQFEVEPGPAADELREMLDKAIASNDASELIEYAELRDIVTVDRIRFEDDSRTVEAWSHSANDVNVTQKYVVDWPPFSDSWPYVIKNFADPPTFKSGDSFTFTSDSWPVLEYDNSATEPKLNNAGDPLDPDWMEKI